MKVTIRPGLAAGTVAAPPAKSYAHRLILAAALAAGESRIHGLAYSEDVMATMDCARALGAALTRDGSTLRFFLPVALAHGGRSRFTGAPRLIERGVGLYEALLGARGVVFTTEQAAVTVAGTLRGGDYALPGDVSSQFVSGLLFALPLLAADSTVRVLPPFESRAYTDITVDVLRRFGVQVAVDGDAFAVAGRQVYRPQETTVEGDWSNAAFLYALTALGGSVTVTGLDPASVQGDRVVTRLLQELDGPAPQIDVSGCPDLAPVLFAVAAAQHGAVFTGTRRLRIKESDRAAVMAEELAKCGVVCEIGANRVVIPGGRLQAPAAPFCGHNDHRVVMALAVLASRTGGAIEGAAAVRKSWPDFFAVLRRLGMEIEDEA